MLRKLLICVTAFLAGSFQMPVIIQGIFCHQCEHPRTYKVEMPCESRDCYEDPFHKKILERFFDARDELIKVNNATPDLEVEELCYVKLDQPIPFHGHSKGCYAALQVGNRTMEGDETIKYASSYEQLTYCDTDNCNNFSLTIHIGDSEIRTEQGRLKMDKPDLQDDEDGGSQLQISMSLLALLLILLFLDYY